MLRLPLSFAVYMVALQRRPGCDLIDVVAQALPLLPRPSPATGIVVGVPPQPRLEGLNLLGQKPMQAKQDSLALRLLPARLRLEWLAARRRKPCYPGPLAPDPSC